MRVSTTWLSNSTVSTIGPLSSMVMTTSAPSAAEAALGATVPPADRNASALESVRFQAVTGNPDLSKLVAMGPPIRPVPRKAIRGVLMSTAPDVGLPRAE